MNEPENLRPLHELDDHTVSDESPDVRGWPVVLNGESIGKVDDLIVDTSAMKARYMAVGLDKKIFNLREDRHVLIPVSSAHVDHDDSNVLVSGITLEKVAQLPGYGALPHSAGAGKETHAHPGYDRDYDARFGRAEDVTRQGRRITRAEEELRVGKRPVKTGEVRIGKHVETDHVSQPVTRSSERVTVERRPVSGEHARDHSFQDQEIRVPVVEEELVVEKRPVVKEELVVGKERVEETTRAEADLRKERFDVDKEGRARVEEGREPYRRGE
jgi:uncharacterized protein (TIGR02271 family)